jgi:protein O-mannosyl-transferase
MKKNGNVASKTAATAQHIYSQKNRIPVWLLIIPPLSCILLVALFYLPSVHYPFQFDSVANIAQYFSIRHLGFWDHFLKNTRWISYWLNTVYYSLGQFDPTWYHIGNFLIHALNGILIYFLLIFGLSGLRKKSFFSTHAISLSLFTTVLFLLHPVQTQTVTYVIQGQLEGLAALFILSMTLCFFFVTQAHNIVAKTLLTALLFVLALFSCGTKEIAIIAPALIFTFDWFFIAQGSFAEIKKRIWLYALLSLFIVGVYLYYLKPEFFTSVMSLKKTAANNIGNVITEKPGMTITPWMFFRSQFKVIVHYLVMFIWPFTISVEYDWVLSKSIFSPDALFPLLLLLALAFGVYKTLTRTPVSLVGFGIIWFFICIIPRSSIIPSPELLVDYKTYLASCGWLFVLAAGCIAGLEYVLNKIKSIPALFATNRYGRQICGLVATLVLGLMTVQQNFTWRSGLDFWGTMIKTAPGKARAYNNYGVELSQTKRDFQGAIPYFLKAISMDANYPDPLNNLAVAYSSVGRLDEAIAALQKSIRLNPYYPEGYNNIASFYIQKNDLVQAERALVVALKLRPYYGKAYFNRGRIHLARNEKEKAWECFKNACTNADLDNKFGFSLYAKTSLELKKYSDAIAGYEKVMQLEPTDMASLFNLANSYYLAGNHRHAQELYQVILKQYPDKDAVWYNMAEAHFELKEYDKALTSYQKAYNLRNQIPLISFRIAACYEHIGQPEAAKQTLANFLKEPHTGNQAEVDQLKATATKDLIALNTRYNNLKGRKSA